MNAVKAIMPRSSLLLGIMTFTDVSFTYVLIACRI